MITAGERWIKTERMHAIEQCCECNGGGCGECNGCGEQEVSYDACVSCGAEPDRCTGCGGEECGCGTSCMCPAEEVGA